MAGRTTQVTNGSPPTSSAAPARISHFVATMPAVGSPPLTAPMSKPTRRGPVGSLPSGLSIVNGNDPFSKGNYPLASSKLQHYGIFRLPFPTIEPSSIPEYDLP